MTMVEVTPPEAVRVAAREFGALGEETFLYEYGYGQRATVLRCSMGGCTLPGLFLERHTGTSTLTSDRLLILISAGRPRLPRNCASSGLKSGGLATITRGDDKAPHIAGWHAPPGVA